MNVPQQYHPQQHHQGQQQFSPPPQQQQQQQHKGTLVPGQLLSVGKVKVTVEKYLSEGGFAHVYLVKTAELINGTDRHVLKRVAVREKSLLDEVRREVEVMKLLRGHPNIVNLIDADAFKLPDGTHEVLILMEFCAGGGIIDMMNRRLRERLTEEEILQVFVDVCEGVAKMHSLSPPLIHRDLKVENILQSTAHSFKLCDFGSVATARPPPSTVAEMREVELDINTHTTIQYRAPEMVDVYQRRVIDEKSDIWALGVLLYKLCYYTTPFEEHGPLAILNVQYRVPPFPVYSNRINLLIGSMLQEHGMQRPSAVQILTTVHAMRGTKSLHRYNEPRAAQQADSSQNLFDIISSVPAPAAPAPALNITPMRRGRPTKGAGGPDEPSPGPAPAVAAVAAALNGNKAQFNLTGEAGALPDKPAPPAASSSTNKFPPPQPSFSTDFKPSSSASYASSSGGFASDFAPTLPYKPSQQPLVTSPLPKKDALPGSAAMSFGTTFSPSPSSSSYAPNRSFLPNPSVSQSSATPLVRPSSTSSTANLLPSNSSYTSRAPPLSKSPAPMSPPAPPAPQAQVPFDGFADLIEPTKTAASARSNVSARWNPNGSSAPASATPPQSATSPSPWGASFSSSSTAGGFGDSFAPSSSTPTSRQPSPLPPSRPEPPQKEPSFDDRFPSFETFDAISSPPPPPPLPERQSIRSPSPPRASRPQVPTVQPASPEVHRPTPLSSTARTQSFVHHLTGPSSSHSEGTNFGSATTRLAKEGSQPMQGGSRSQQVTGAGMKEMKSARPDEGGPLSGGGQSEGWSQLTVDGPTPSPRSKGKQDFLTGDDGYSALQDPKTIHKAMSPSPLASTKPLPPVKPVKPVVAPKPATLDVRKATTTDAKSEPSFSPPSSANKAVSPTSSYASSQATRGKTLPPPAVTATKPTRPRLNEPVQSSSSILSDQWSPLEDARKKLAEVATKDDSGDEIEEPEEVGRGGWKGRMSSSAAATGSKPVDEFGARSSTSTSSVANPVARRYGSPALPSNSPAGPREPIGGPRAPQPKPASTSAASLNTMYNAPPRLTTSNSSSSSASAGLRRLPTIDADAASSFLRGPSSAKSPINSVASPVSSGGARARPTSMYGAPSPITSPAASAGGIQRGHGRGSSISDTRSPLSPPPPVVAPKPTKPVVSVNTRVAPPIGGPKPLKSVTPTRGRDDGERVVKGTRYGAERKEEGTDGKGESRGGSVSSLISRWNSGQ